jgi:hypothetical protein
VGRFLASCENPRLKLALAHPYFSRRSRVDLNQLCILLVGLPGGGLTSFFFFLEGDSVGVPYLRGGYLRVVEGGRAIFTLLPRSGVDCGFRSGRTPPDFALGGRHGGRGDSAWETDAFPSLPVFLRPIRAPVGSIFSGVQFYLSVSLREKLLRLRLSHTPIIPSLKKRAGYAPFRSMARVFFWGGRDFFLLGSIMPDTAYSTDPKCRRGGAVRASGRMRRWSWEWFAGPFRRIFSGAPGYDTHCGVSCGGEVCAHLFPIE